MTVRKVDEDTAVVISSSVTSGRDPCPDRRDAIEQRDPVPATEWVSGDVSPQEFRLHCTHPDREHEEEWISTTTASSLSEWQ